MMSIIVWLLAMIWIGVWAPLLLRVWNALKPLRVEPLPLLAEPAPKSWLEVPDDELLAEARILTALWGNDGASGEYKRHQVLAALIDAFPDRSKRDLARAIEVALG